MRSKHAEFFAKTFLFSGIGGDRIGELLRDTEIKEMRLDRGENVTQQNIKESLFFVCDGECTAERIRADEEAVPLNSLKRYSSFGILSLFSENEPPTRIRARCASVLLLISKSDVIELIKSSSEVALNVTKFLCDRVAFLNDKIATFTEKTTISKLSTHLVCTADENGEIPYAPTRIAAIIGSSRASLYRDIATLEQEGHIKIENKKIKILSPKGLERKQ